MLASGEVQPLRFFGGTRPFLVGFAECLPLLLPPGSGLHAAPLLLGRTTSGLLLFGLAAPLSLLPLPRLDLGDLAQHHHDLFEITSPAIVRHGDRMSEGQIAEFLRELARTRHPRSPNQYGDHANLRLGQRADDLVPVDIVFIVEPSDTLLVGGVEPTRPYHDEHHRARLERALDLDPEVFASAESDRHP